VALVEFLSRHTGHALSRCHGQPQLDRGHANVLAELLAHIATDPATITWVMPMTSVCRYLGRISDHIRSLAGEVIYMVRAEHVRHPEA
jgi:phosphate uptake regulator